MKKIVMALAAAASLALPVGSADAQSYYYYRHHRYYRPAYPPRTVVVYDRYGRYAQPRYVTRRTYMWRARDGRYYCRRDNGTTGLIIGATGGAFLGSSLSHRGDRAAGTIVGAALGALLGNEIDRNQLRCW